MIEICVSKQDLEKIMQLDEFDVDKMILQTSGAQYIHFYCECKKKGKQSNPILDDPCQSHCSTCTGEENCDCSMCKYYLTKNKSKDTS